MDSSGTAVEIATDSELRLRRSIATYRSARSRRGGRTRRSVVRPDSMSVLTAIIGNVNALGPL